MINKIYRLSCPGCCTSNEKNKVIFSRDFSLFKSIMAFNKYDVFICQNCGLVYAGNIEENIPLKIYYEEMSKYEGDNYVLSPQLHHLYHFVVKNLSSLIKKDSSILDVGCAFGGLLNELKSNKFIKLCGLEPSLKNCQYARDNYGIKVIHGCLGETKLRDKFDLVILNCVLEHLLDIKNDLMSVKEMLNDQGFIAITVPDISLFIEHSDLFQEFSTEHINYFGIDSLNFIMNSLGFKKVLYVNSTFAVNFLLKNVK